MYLHFNDKLITGVLTVLPQTELRFEDEIGQFNFPEKQSRRLARVMGYKSHRIAKAGQTSADFCIHGLEYLFENALLDKESIDALILVTQSPDYFMPPTSNVIQGHFQLRQDMICLDINQGCAGYEVGLIEAFMLLEQPDIHKVVLMNADVLSSRVSRHDRNSWPLMGDAAAITIVEDGGCDNIECSIKMDGTGAFSLQIPAGGFRTPSSAETAVEHEDENGNLRALDNLTMKGDEVFNFVQHQVPPLINDLLARCKMKKDDIDWYLFHQPNKFMLNKLADAIGVERAKMPSNIVENFGNASGVTVPTNISYNLGEKLLNESYNVCLSGFGVGLTRAAIIMRLGPVRFNKIIEF